MNKGIGHMITVTVSKEVEVEFDHEIDVDDIISDISEYDLVEELESRGNVVYDNAEEALDDIDTDVLVNELKQRGYTISEIWLTPDTDFGENSEVIKVIFDKLYIDGQFNKMFFDELERQSHQLPRNK